MRDSRTIATRIVAIYALAGLTWIYGTDALAGLLPQPYADAVQPIKGSLFIAATAIGLYVLIERVANRFVSEATGARAMERLLSQVVGRMPVGIIITTADSRVTFLNASAEEMLGVITLDVATHCVDEVMGRGMADTAALLGQVMRTGESEILPIAGPTEEPRYVVAQAAHIDPDSKAAGWVIAFTEVTHKQASIAQLERMAEGYRVLAAIGESCTRVDDEVELVARVAEIAAESELFHSAWAVWIDRASQRHREVASPGMGERSREIASVLVEDDVERLLGMERVGEDASPVAIANDIAGDPSNPFNAAAEKDGVRSAATIRVDSGAGPFGLITMFASEPGAFGVEDVEMLTRAADEVSFACGRLFLERHRLSAEEELHDSEQAYRMLFQHHPAPMWVYDMDTLGFLAVNDAAVAKYGFSREQFLGMTIADIRPKDDVPALLLNIGNVRDGFEDAGVWAHRDIRGREFPVHIYSHTIEWAGHPAELVMAMEVARFE